MKIEVLLGAKEVWIVCTGYGRTAHQVGKVNFKGKKKPTIVLEAVALKDLCIWHASVGTPGALNVINFLNWSTLFDGYVNGQHNPDNF